MTDTDRLLDDVIDSRRGSIEACRVLIGSGFGAREHVGEIWFERGRRSSGDVHGRRGPHCG